MKPRNNTSLHPPSWWTLKVLYALHMTLFQYNKTKYCSNLFSTLWIACPQIISDFSAFSTTKRHFLASSLVEGLNVGTILGADPCGVHVSMKAATELILAPLSSSGENSGWAEIKKWTTVGLAVYSGVFGGNIPLDLKIWEILDVFTGLSVPF